MLYEICNCHCTVLVLGCLECWLGGGRSFCGQLSICVMRRGVIGPHHSWKLSVRTGGTFHQPYAKLNNLWRSFYHVIVFLYKDMTIVRCRNSVSKNSVKRSNVLDSSSFILFMNEIINCAITEI